MYKRGTFASLMSEKTYAGTDMERQPLGPRRGLRNQAASRLKDIRTRGLDAVKKEPGARVPKGDFGDVPMARTPLAQTPNIPAAEASHTRSKRGRHKGWATKPPVTSRFHPPTKGK